MDRGTQVAVKDVEIEGDEYSKQLLRSLKGRRGQVVDKPGGPELPPALEALDAELPASTGFFPITADSPGWGNFGEKIDPECRLVRFPETELCGEFLAWVRARHLEVVRAPAA